MFFFIKRWCCKFAHMKKALIFIGLLLIVCAALAQTVNIRGSKMILQYGANNYSVELKGDSVLIDASDFIWFADKFGSDTLLFGDGTYMTTADTYVKLSGDTMGNSAKFQIPYAGLFEVDNGSSGRSFIGNYQYGYIGCDSTVWGGSCIDGKLSARLHPNHLYFTNTEYTTDVMQFRLVKGECAEYDTIYSETGLVIRSYDILMQGRINGLEYDSDSTVNADDASIVLTNGIYGWGEVYAFNAGAIDEWAEFIISSDGAVYLKSNSTDVVNTDTDNKLCIFDNGSGVTIRNRLGGVRTIKYIIHH